MENLILTGKETMAVRRGKPYWVAFKGVHGRLMSAEFHGVTETSQGEIFLGEPLDTFYVAHDNVRVEEPDIMFQGSFAECRELAELMNALEAL